MPKYLPTNDLLFKKMFTSKDSMHILKAFVRDVLGKDFKRLTPRETYHIDSYKQAFEEQAQLMYTEVDVLAEDEEGRHVTIEMQIQPHDFFLERSLFYLTEAYRSPLGNQDVKDFIKNNNFSALRPAYGINILDFHLLEKSEAAIRKFSLMDLDTRDMLRTAHGEELVMLCFFSLKNHHIPVDSAAYHWQQFFNTGEVTDSAPEYLKEAKRKTDYYSLDEEEQIMIANMDKAKMINDAVMATALREAREEGVEQGIEQGIAEGILEGMEARTIELAMTMLKENEAIEKIARYTNLTVTQLKEMKRKLE